MKPPIILQTLVRAVTCVTLAGLPATVHGQQVAAGCSVEVFVMSLEDWNHVPPEVRDNPAQLYQKCRASAGKGRIESFDRIGGNGCVGKKSLFDAIMEYEYGGSFSTNGKMVMPSGWLTRNTGTSLSFDAGSGTNRQIAAFIYDHVSPVLLLPLMTEGSPDNIKRSEVPIFDAFRITGCHLSTAATGPQLLGAMPVPAAGGKPTQMGMAFAHVTGLPPGPEKPALLEALLLRGASGRKNEEPAACIKALMETPGALETDVMLSVAAGQKTRADSITEWVCPTAALQFGEVLLPSHLNTVNQGVQLTLDCNSTAADTYDMNLVLNYAFKKPVMPAVASKGGPHIVPDHFTFYQANVKERVKLAAGAWTCLKEIPLGGILGQDDSTANGQSAYLFLRILEEEVN
ncbi:MAG: hypothetical protein ABI600_11615 [Luteolibacter sp.]